LLDAGCSLPVAKILDTCCWLFDYECLDWKLAIDIVTKDILDL